jgi:hypothetical protein
MELVANAQITSVAPAVLLNVLLLPANRQVLPVVKSHHRSIESP